MLVSQSQECVGCTVQVNVKGHTLHGVGAPVEAFYKTNKNFYAATISRIFEAEDEGAIADTARDIEEASEALAAKKMEGDQADVEAKGWFTHDKPQRCEVCGFPHVPALCIVLLQSFGRVAALNFVNFFCWQGGLAGWRRQKQNSRVFPSHHSLHTKVRSRHLVRGHSCQCGHRWERRKWCEVYGHSPTS